MTVIYMMLLTGIILLYVDMKFESSSTVKREYLPRKLHQQIVDMGDEENSILRPMFTESRDIYVAAYEGQKFVDGDLSRARNPQLE